MAIGFVAIKTAIASAGAIGSSAVLGLVTPETIALGNHLMLFIALDNSGTSGTDPDVLGVVDPTGNVWYRLGRVTREPSGITENDGAHAEAWFTRVVVPYEPGAQLTLNFSFSVARGSFKVNEYSGIRPVSYPVETTEQTGSGLSIALPTLNPEVGQLVIGMAAVETNATVTGDADTTNGSWSAASPVVSNSGVEATSMTLIQQHKIVTASGPQNWAATKTGANVDYAALGFVFDVFVPADPDFIPGNPNYPCIAGSENLSAFSRAYPVDTGTAYMFNHKIFPNDLGSQDYGFVASVGVAQSTQDEPVSNHTIVGDVYVAGNELPTNDFINSAAMLVDSASTTGEVWNPDSEAAGAGTELQAISKVGGECIKLEANQNVDLTFNTAVISQNFPNYRILRWGIRYIAFKDDSEPPGPTNGIQVFILDSQTNGGAGGQYLAAGWLTNNYRGTGQYETRWFGEVNGNPRAFRQGFLQPGDYPHRACWTPADFVNMASGELTVQIQAVSSEVFLDYIEAVVELAPERRVAQGARTISTAPFNEGLFPTGSLISRVVKAADASERWVVEDTDAEYVLVVREGLPASPSDLFPTLVEDTGGVRTIASVEAIGPPVTLTSPIGPRVADPKPVRVGTLSRGVLQLPPEETETIQAMSVTAMDGVNYPLEGSYFPSYYLAAISGGIEGLVFSGNDQNQYIRVPGAQQYDRIKVLVSHADLTAGDLDITIEQPAGNTIATAVVTASEVPEPAVASDIGPFVEVSAVLDIPITPTAGRVLVVLSSSTESSAPWYVGGAIPPFLYTGYDVTEPNVATEYYDYAVVLQCPLANPTYTLGTESVEIVVGSENCTATSTDLPTVTLTNGGLYDHVSITRVIDGNAVPAALLDAPADDQVFVDYEAPWDIESGGITYRITGYRNVDRRQVETTTTGWDGVSTAPGAAFGFFSNELETGFAYIPVDSRELEVEYNPMNPVQMVQRHGVDYQTALFAPEERGYSVSVNVIASRIGICSDSESPSASMDMSPDGFAALKSLERNRRMMLKLPGGHARFVYVKMGPLTVRVQRNTYLAQVTLTDAEIPSVDPYS